MQNKFSVLLMVALLVFAGSASAGVVIQMNLVDSGGPGAVAGTITAEQTSYGVVFNPQLRGLTPGAHGFHVHQHPSCQAKEKNGKMVPALAAGGHFDPAATGHHGTPWGTGHLGDLPVLDVDADGRASTPVLAPRLKLDDLQGRSIMIHAGGDNYSDQPKKLGGGGARMACGVVK